MSESRPPAGWYPDYDGDGQRYWDGSQWTSFTFDAVEDGAPAPGDEPNSAADSDQSRIPTSDPATDSASDGMQPDPRFPWVATTTGFVQVKEGELFFRHSGQTGSLLVDDVEYNNKKPGLFRDVGHIDFTTPAGSLVQVEYEKENKDAMSALLKALEVEQEKAATDLIIAQAYYAPGVEGAEAAGYGANLKKGEVLFKMFGNASLVEVKRAPGHFQAGTSSVRFRVMKGVSVGVGGARGRYVPGPESPTPIDIGDVFITSTRVQFMGSRQSREWSFAKLIGLQPSEDGQWTAMPVTNRQKVSGIGYGQDMAFEVNFWLELALAQYQGRREQWAQTIEHQLRGQITP